MNEQKPPVPPGSRYCRWLIVIFGVQILLFILVAGFTLVTTLLGLW